jgi:hypothetical protein
MPTGKVAGERQEEPQKTAAGRTADACHHGINTSSDA